MTSPAPHPHRPRADDFRGLIRLAVPIVFVQLGLLALLAVTGTILVVLAK